MPLLCTGSSGASGHMLWLSSKAWHSGFGRAERTYAQTSAAESLHSRQQRTLTAKLAHLKAATGDQLDSSWR